MERGIDRLRLCTVLLFTFLYDMSKQIELESTKSGAHGALIFDMISYDSVAMILGPKWQKVKVTELYKTV